MLIISNAILPWVLQQLHQYGTLLQILHTLAAKLVMQKLNAAYAFYYKLKMQQTKHLKISNTLWSNSKCIVPLEAPNCLSPLWLLPIEPNDILLCNLVVCWL
jgi:hypothetical protein